jgi:hypothetical protein
MQYSWAFASFFKIGTSEAIRNVGSWQFPRKYEFLVWYMIVRILQNLFFFSVDHDTKTISPWYTRSYGNTEVSEEYKFSYSEIAICKTGKRNYHGICASWLQVPPLLLLHYKLI